ncbi:hypothetical protein LCGC14_1524660 [marine sediment metagenome]|uniref:CopG-like ribbon-helix-helix domain-containing protein n=1 Tax=marine sediment metagenome TaxID=412755 RepID=A0A0F9JIG6_9ZZZZ
MSPPKGLKSVAIPEELYERLKALRKPHQALAGVIEELLAEVDKGEQNNKEAE